MKTRINILFLLFVFYFQSFSQNLFEGRFSRERSYDVLHYKIDVKIDLEKQNIKGSVLTTLVPLKNIDLLDFDSERIKINKVLLNNKELDFSTTKNHLLITLDHKYSNKDTVKVKIEYECAPKGLIGAVFFKPDSFDTDKQYQSWSQGEEELNHFWFPCYDFPDDRMTSETILTVDKEFYAVSNGKLLNITENRNNSTKTYHWLQDKEHVTYLISFVVGKYKLIRDNYKNLPLEYYVYPKLAEDAKRIFSPTKNYVDFFTRILDEKYPWDKYAQIIVQDCFGGMENTSVTTLIDDIPDKKYFENDEKYTHFYTTLIIHELAHQWFGDLITCKNWIHLWLNEGFAEFLPGYYFEQTLNKDEAKVYFINELENYFKLRKQMPTVSLHSNNVYPKGALILNMLRYVVGEELFWKSMKEYVDIYKNKCVETSDFKSVVEGVTKQNLDWFFDEWLYKSGHPKFDVNYNYDESAKILKIIVKQTQLLDSINPIFKTPVDIKIITSKEKITKRIWVDSLINTFYFNIQQKPLLVDFDPDNFIIKELTFKKKKEEIVFQLNNDENILGRISAIKASLDYRDDAELFSLISKLALEDKFWKVRVAAIEFLSRCKSDKIIPVIFSAYKDKNSLVRKEVISACGSLRGNKIISDFLRKAINDKSNGVVSQSIYSIIAVDSTDAIKYLLPLVSVPTYRNRLQELVIGGLIRLKSTEAIPILMEYSKKGKSQLARNSCMLGLSTIAPKHPELFDFFIENLKHSHSYYRRISASGLANLKDKKAIPYLEELKKIETNSLVLDAIQLALKILNK